MIDVDQRILAGSGQHHQMGLVPMTGAFPFEPEISGAPSPWPRRFADGAMEKDEADDASAHALHARLRAIAGDRSAGADANQPTSLLRLGPLAHVGLWRRLEFLVDASYDDLLLRRNMRRDVHVRAERVRSLGSLFGGRAVGHLLDHLNPEHRATA
jgi:hypothetical protein